ncbi:alpha/beta hydrolase [Microbacterium sp. 18062]|uniref:alpha/beta hydrolase n=1 Tax=Microbacterium sp. 18062 TaxID=2681410 RepID=UPI00135A913B|nr:alpha/beta hydrolase [Microbacterium sp. 18062]
MRQSLRSLIADLGVELTPDLITATQTTYARIMPPPDRRVTVVRDIAYGPHDRHRLDVFHAHGPAETPVLLYVHGGGFVGGDKRSPSHPFYDNVGDFAARSGLLGVTMNYRLAPGHPWPSGSDDVAAAVRWVRAHATEFGGSPERIFMMGQSAGAVHVADLVAASPDDLTISGAILVSGLYDIVSAERTPLLHAYYGEEAERYEAMSPTAGLLRSDVPLLHTISEFDIPDFQRQAARFVDAHASARGTYPRMHYLTGHNHLSPVLALGTPEDTLGPLIAEFILGHGHTLIDAVL